MMVRPNGLLKVVRGTRSCAWLGLALLSIGCGTGPEAEFKLRPTTEDLIPPALSAVKDTLRADFGTPNALVAWERLPIDYSAAKGTVDAVNEDKSIVVTIAGNADEVHAGAPIFWLTGPLATPAPADAQIKDYHADTRQLVLADGQQPTAGDTFVVGFGKNLQYGRQVYMKNCMHCHGVAGDGAGPTAEFLNPRPRDYRSGLFKFTSTKAGVKPSRDDLARIVKYGVPGTYMPSFLLIGDEETVAVVEYVRWLSIRGEFEKRLVGELTSDYALASISDSVKKEESSYKEKRANKEEAERPRSLGKAKSDAAAEFKKYLTEDYPGAVDETADILAASWATADDADSVVLPGTQRVADTAESRERGRILFLSDKTKCYTCHGPTGKGDGGATEDFWPKPGTTEKYDERGLHDEWGFLLKPRNLTLGQYRGGRRPIDVFRRLYAGIKGTPMPAFGGTALKDDEIWDIVNYVMSLPFNAKQPTAAPPAGHVVKLEETPTK